VPVWGDIERLEGTRLRDESVDAVIISNTFFLLIYKKTCIMEMKRILKRGGKILFVDWHKPMGQAQMHSKIVLHEKEIENLFVEIGMKVFPLLEKDDNHFALIIEK
jgi:ubiquinone/menaquinone biosynthesis C-methylase UbiE